MKWIGVEKSAFGPHQFRYVCSKCPQLRTFLSDEYHEDWFCWECGSALEVIPKITEEDDNTNKQNRNLMGGL